MRRSSDFSTAVRAGSRAGRPTLVVHVLPPEHPTAGLVSTVGFVVSRAVGGAVVRNRVRRRLRHLCATHVAHLPAGSRLVVRALPPSSEATGQQLATDLDRALARATSRLTAPAVHR